MSTLRNQILGATLAVGTAFGAVVTPAAADEQDNSNIVLAAASKYETVDRDTAKTRSAGGIVLHFGEGFPERPVRVLTEMLEKKGFRTEALSGGTQDKITICLNGQCWGEDFDVGNSAQILLLADQYGQSLLASRQQAPDPSKS